MNLENIRIGSDQILVADLNLKLPLYVVREGLHPRRIEVHPGTVLHDICLWVIQDHLDKAKAAKARASFDAAGVRGVLAEMLDAGEISPAAHTRLFKATLTNCGRLVVSKDPAPIELVNLADVEIDQRVTVSVEPCVRDFIRNLEEMVVMVATGIIEEREKRGD